MFLLMQLFISIADTGSEIQFSQKHLLDRSVSQCIVPIDGVIVGAIGIDGIVDCQIRVIVIAFERT